MGGAGPRRRRPYGQFARSGSDSPRPVGSPSAFTCREEPTGQGGPSTGYDIIKRKKTTWDPNALQGWVDLELYFGARAQTGPVPDWLAGWWKVTWRRQPYYYYFGSGGEVKWTQALPLNTSQPPIVARDTGKVVIGPSDAVTISWPASGTVEKLVKAPAATRQMGGTWNGREPLSAVKL